MQRNARVSVWGFSMSPPPDQQGLQNGASLNEQERLVPPLPGGHCTTGGGARASVPQTGHFSRISDLCPFQRATHLFVSARSLYDHMFKETARMLDMWSHFYGNGVGVSLPRWDNVTFHWCHCNAFLLQWILCASLASHGAFQSECLQWKVSRSKYFFLLFYFSLVLVPMVNVYQNRVLHCGIPAGFTKSVLLG